MTLEKWLVTTQNKEMGHEPIFISGRGDSRYFWGFLCSVLWMHHKAGGYTGTRFLFGLDPTRRRGVA